MKKTKYKMPNLPTVEVKTDRSSTLGFLYFETDNFVVILNHLRSGGDYGSLKSFRCEHLLPEAHVMIFPREIVKKIQYKTKK